jgi:hypothetical protein
MSPHIIRNPVPTPEQMAKILGISSERVTAVREIMGTPLAEAGRKRAKRHVAPVQKLAFKSKSAKVEAKRKGARGKNTAHRACISQHPI